MDRDLQQALQKALQAGVNPQSAQLRAQQIQQQRNNSSVLSGNLTSGNLVANNGLVGNLINSVARPFVKTGQMIGGSAFEVARALASKTINPNVYAIDPKTKKAVYQNPFLSQKTLEQTNTNPAGIIGNQIKQSAALASYGIPIGGSTKFLGASIAPGAFKGGAIAGGLQALSDPNADASSVATAALTGGALGKAFEVGGKALGAIGKGGSKLENASTNLRTGKVNLKASVSGAADEKAAQAVLSKYGIKGTPQARYEKIQPVMDSISQEIDAILSRNSQKIGKTQIEQTFLEKIKPYIRQGDITLAEAKQGFREYANSVQQIDPTVFTNTKSLFGLKKDLQAGMSSLYKKVESGASLTPSQKSLKAIRDTIDELITKANPEIKQLTIDQSKLFDSVKSISAARKTVPTARVFGNTIPKGVANEAMDVAGRAGEGVGGVASKVGNIQIPGVAKQGLPRVGAVLSQGLSSGQSMQQPYDAGYNPDTQLNQNYSYNNGNNYSQDNAIISQQNQYGFTITPAMVQNAYLTQTPEVAARVKQLYDLQQEAIKSGAGAKKTEAEQARSDAAYLVESAMSKLQAGNVKLGPVSAPIEEFKSIFNAGDPATIEFNRTIAALKGAIAKARAGTSFTPNEEKLLNQYTPTVGDSYQQVLSKLMALQQFFGNR